MNPTPANDAVYAASAAQVRTLTLNEGAERVQREREATKRDELWLGSAYGEPHDEDIPVYVRLAQPMSVVAELVSAVIGRALGLPVTEPFVVAIGKGVLSQSRMIDPQAEVSFAFASRNVGGDTFTQLLREDSRYAQQLLLGWAHLAPLAAFDEWLANTDRNFGNILFVANALWLIDHAEAFGGSMRGLFDLSEIVETPLRNNIADIINELTAKQRHQHLQKVRQWVDGAAASLSLREALEVAGVSRWLAEDGRAELLDFVTRRLTVTYTLLCQRLGHPQLPLSPTANQAASA